MRLVDQRAIMAEPVQTIHDGGGDAALDTTVVPDGEAVGDPEDAGSGDVQGNKPDAPATT